MGEEKEQKPKKAFELKVIIWDDGEIDAELNEYRPNPSGRGAPGKWRVSQTDFVRRIEETLGDSERIIDTVYEAVGGAVASGSSNKKFISTQVLSMPVVQDVSNDTIPTPPAEKDGKKKKKSAASESGEPHDDSGMDFGTFDDKGDNQ